MRGTNKFYALLSVLSLLQPSVFCGAAPIVDEVIGSGLFEFHVHDEETLFDRFSGELSFNGIPVLPVSTSSQLVGQPAGSWRDLLNWDGTYNVVNEGVVWTKQVVDVLGRIATFNVRVAADFESLGNLLHDSGPTERLVGHSFTIPLTGADDPQVNAIIQLEKLEVSATAGASILFYAIIGSDTAISMDQANVILEEMTLETGAHLIGNPTMLIRTNVTNFGKISSLAGIIEGDFKNGASQGQTWKKEIQLDIPFLKVILLIMARPIRIVYEGAVYHITIRGNERRSIFKNDEDRSYFITKLAESVQRYNVRLYLFTLMRNHTHLVLETPRGGTSGGTSGAGDKWGDKWGQPLSFKFILA